MIVENINKCKSLISKLNLNFLLYQSCPNFPYIQIIMNLIFIINQPQIYLMLSLFATRIVRNFAKWSKPKPKVNKLKQDKKSFSMGDEKAAKLSKSEQEQQNKMKQLEQQKIEQQTRRQIGIYRLHHKSLEEYVSKQDLQNIRYQQIYYLKGQKTPKKQITPVEKPKEENMRYLQTDLVTLNADNVRIRKQPVYGNYTDLYNKNFKANLKQIPGHQKLRRVGTLGTKLGMTSMWDKWGNMVPVTIIELDRVQIVQIKEPRHDNEYYQVQMGIGQKNIKRLKKAELGHFIKAGVPPKRVVAQFKVSKQCLLPVGYMMTPRHYTPGMFVDVVSRSVGHGFQGTIKRYRFRRQPETHGNSTTTRVLGSTGCRQDPGRVFKNKKMYGHMGNKIAVQSGLTVFRIDVDKNILYLKGSVPGKPGTVVKIRDTLNLDKIEMNLDLVHYPTFVQEEGVQYARLMSMYCGERDPEEMEVHDNAYMIDEDEEEAAATTAAGSKQDAKDKDLDQ